MIKSIPNFEGLNCTINTTEDCNLRCKYCYETHKKPNNISFDYCKAFVDLILEAKENDIAEAIGTDLEFVYDGIVLDFIGGDSLVDPALLDKILTYFSTKVALKKLQKPEWLPKGWRASISTNGTLFAREDVRAFCEKWKDNLSIGVSIDGCPEIHDMNRIFVNGEGTMSTIMKWWSWYRQHFPTQAQSTKATCSRASIPYLFESLKFMHEDLGLNYINQNFIMEDTGCTEEDYKELDRQLEMCVNYVLEHKDEMYWSMIDKHNFAIHHKDFNKEEDDAFYTKGRCGSGCMPCLSIDGNIYPCFRWLPHSQNGVRGVMQVGDVWNGFNHTENFTCVRKGAIRDNCTREEKCRTCEYEPACSYCIAGCYAEHSDFIRTTHICEIIKLQCKWADYYWSKIDG